MSIISLFFTSEMMVKYNTHHHVAFLCFLYAIYLKVLYHHVCTFVVLSVIYVIVLTFIVWLSTYSNRAPSHN